MNLSMGITNFTKKFTAIALSLLLCQPTFAQSSENQQMAFEGTLTDTNGNPINLASATLTFFISANGCYLYSEWSSTAGDSQGNIFHRFGSGSMSGSSPNTFSQNLFFGNVSGTTTFAGNDCSVTAADTRLAQVQVFYAAQNISATIKLGTVPYAQNATMLGGKSASQFIQASADTNTLFSGGMAGQYLTKSASGLTWTTSTLTTSSITSALGYTPANSATLSNYALRSNNLSDLASATTARSNLGLGSLATKNSVDLNTIEVTGSLPVSKLPSFSGDVSTAAGSSTMTIQSFRGVPLAATAPVSGQVLLYNGSAWSPVTIPSNVGSVTNITAGQGLLGGTITSSGTLSVNFGTSAGTVAAGDDARILGALQSVNNLGDISSATLARNNLGLGSLATKSVINLDTADVSGVLPVANGGSKWTQGPGGIYTVSNTTVGSSTTYTNVGLYVNAPIGVSSPIAASINNTNSDGYGLKINTENTNSLYYGLRVSSFNSTNFVVLNNGNVGIGLSAPNARLHIAGGSTALPGLKLTSGSLTTTPVPGAIEYDGSSYYVTDGNAIRRTVATGSSTNSIDNISNINSTSNITLSTPNSVVVSSTLASTNYQNGALVVKGGLGINGNGNFSGDLNATGNISTSGSITTPNNVFAGAVTTPYLYGSIASGGSLAIDSTSHGNKGNIIIAGNGGNVGIGVTNPSYRFQVRSPAANTYFTTYTPSAQGSMMGFGEDSNNQLFQIMFDAAGTAKNFFTPSGTNYINNPLVVGSTTGVPGYNLSVYGQSIFLDSLTASKTLILNGATTTTPGMQFANTNILATAVAGAVEYDGTSLFYTNSSAQRRRLAGGVTAGTIDNVTKVTYNSGNLTLEGNTASVTPAVTINNLGAGTVALQVNNSATVSGSIKLSGDGADSLTACATADEGKQRYNKTIKSMEYCDGSYWQGVNGPTHCTGSASTFTLIGKPGTGSAFCMSKNNEGFTNYTAAVNGCSNKTTGRGSRANICTEIQYQLACKEYNTVGETGLTGFKTQDYWIPASYSADGSSYFTYKFSAGTVGTCVPADQAVSVFGIISTTPTYRCCYQ